jgi:hypothetical protein
MITSPHPSDPFVQLLAAPKTTLETATRIYRQAFRHVFHRHDLVPVHATILARWGPKGFDEITRISA